MTRRWLSGGLTRDMARISFRDYLGVGDEVADVLVLLYEAGGEPVQARALCMAINSHRPLKIGALYERISVLREAMDTEAVDSANGCYWLSEIGMEECRRAMRDTASALTRSVIEGISFARPKRQKVSARPPLPNQMSLFDAA